MPRINAEAHSGVRRPVMSCSPPMFKATWLCWCSVRVVERAPSQSPRRSLLIGPSVGAKRKCDFGGSVVSGSHVGISH